MYNNFTDCSIPIYSAKELVETRTSKNHIKPLPSMPPKDFVPTNSPHEELVINHMVKEQVSYLQEERVEKR